MFPQDPTRCPHRIVEFNWITPDFAEHYCIACGEVVSWTDNETTKTVHGTPRKLTTREKESLR